MKLEKESLYGFILNDTNNVHSLPILDVDVIAVASISSYSAIAKLNIDGKLYLGTIGHEESRLIPLE